MIKTASIMVALCLSVGMMTGCSSNSNGSLNVTEDASDAASEEISSEPEAVPVEAISEASNAVSAEAISETSSDASSTESSAVSKETTKTKDKKNTSGKKDEKNKVPETPQVKDGVTKIGEEGIETYFEWDPVEGADRYEVMIEGKPDGSTSYNLLESNYTSRTEYSYTGKLNYNIRIKVRAYSEGEDGELCGEWSEFAEGKTSDEALETPVVKDGVVTASGAKWSVLFEWEAVEGADNYEIVVEEKASDKSDFTILERTYTNGLKYTYTGTEGNDIRITVKANKNVWTDGKKKVLSSQPSSYAKGKTYK